VKLSRISIAVALALAASAAAAQNRVVLSFFEDRSGELRVVGPRGEQEKRSAELAFGDEVPVGWTVITGKDDDAELTMPGNGTIIKIAENTNFRVEALQGAGGAASNDFALDFGRFRAVAARTRSDRYTVRGKTTVCGVRGTDFGMSIEVGVEEAFVFKGAVDFRKLAGGPSLVINAGEFANALAASFTAARMSSAQAAALQSQLAFQKLDPASVPQAQTAETPVPPAPEMPPKPEGKVAEGGFLDTVLGALGMEIGSLTVGDQTYAKAVISPTISVNKLKMQLYLPVIYQDDLFNPNDWYEPRGNNEWSFGTDQGDDWIDIAGDFAADLALKFKYLQYGDQRDPFFFKLGNLNTFTIGHGLIMRNYANDSEFPAVRRVGLNLGADFRTIGFEAVVNDLADIQIAGGRLYLRPTPETFPLAIGVSGIVDLYPARGLGEVPGMPGTDWKDVIGDPMLINTGLDLEYALIRTDPLSVVLFGDIAGMMPYYRKDGAGPYAAISEGLDTDTLLVDGKLRNYGWIAGALGNAGPVSWRGEYRYYTGAFVPEIFNNIYDKERGRYAQNAALFSADPAADQFDVLTMGIYGEAGWTWEKVFSFSAGYFWPFTIEGGRWKPAEMDYLHMQARLERGVIPFVNVAAAVAYDRYYFVPLLLGGRAGDGSRYGVFDANTVVTSTLWYGISKTVDLVFIATTALARDADGNILYEDDGTTPKLATTIAIETQIHY
jgi:hypothetical protein